MQVYRIDDKGYYIRPVILKGSNAVPIDCVEIQPPNGLYKARWTGAEWIEAGTPPEPQPKELTEVEILKERLEATELALIELMMEG